MRTRLLWAVSASAVAVLGVVMAVWLLRCDGAETPGEATPKFDGVGGSSMADAPDVYQALGRLTTDPGSLVSQSVRAEVDGRAREAIPAGSEVVVDESSWSPDGLGGGVATVTITAPGGSPATYLVVLVRDPDGWKVQATVPAGLQ